MIGETLVVINQETLVAALQMYFDQKIPGQKVDSVNYLGDISYIKAGELMQKAVVKIISPIEIKLAVEDH